MFYLFKAHGRILYQAQTFFFSLAPQFKCDLLKQIATQFTSDAKMRYIV